MGENFADILSAELDEDDCNLITIEDIHNKIIGIAILRIYRKYLIIEDMIVDGSLRGMSLGKKLMDFIHNFAAEQKLKHCFWKVGLPMIKPIHSLRETASRKYQSLILNHYPITKSLFKFYY